MEKCFNEVVPYPQLMEMLFASRGKISKVFRDVLGLHEISHIAITQVNAGQQLTTFSSTPSMEFNLFNSNLWAYDRTYDLEWIRLCTHDYWHNLYNAARFDELYYLKQIKHSLPIGLSLSSQRNDCYLIYSIASNKSCEHTHELFLNKREEFYKIGLYCFNRLKDLFSYYENSLWEELNLIDEPY